MRIEPGARDEETNELFAELAEALRREVGVRARLRALSTRVRIGLVLGLVGALFLGHFVLRRRPDFSQTPAHTFWATSVLLSVAAVAGTIPLLRGVSARSRRGLPVALWLMPVVTAVLVPFGSSGASWGAPLDCFVYGAACTAPLLFVLELFERRDDVPLTARLAAGALAGIAANLLLHARCPSSHLGHLLLGHASVGFAWSALLGCWPPRAGSR